MPSLVDSALFTTTGLSDGLLPLLAKDTAEPVEVSTTSNRSRYCAESTPSASVGGVTLTWIGGLVLWVEPRPSAAMLPLSTGWSVGLGPYQLYRRNVVAAFHATE